MSPDMREGRSVAHHTTERPDTLTHPQQQRKRYPDVYHRRPTTQPPEPEFLDDPRLDGLKTPTGA